MPRRLLIPLLCLLPALASCRAWEGLRGTAPNQQVIVREQLIVETDFMLPPDHRLLDELTALRTRINRDLTLPESELPIHVRLFANEQTYLDYLRRHYPAVAGRRAFFVRDQELSVYAWWGDHVAEDLRHEATHGYLHSTIKSFPLWLDEGLAEYYEVPEHLNGRHAAHIRLLLASLRDQQWQPDLERLQKLHTVDQMSQLEYAESWLWAHFLLRTSDQRRDLLRTYLQDQIAERPTNEANLAERLQNMEAEQLETRVVAHLLLVGEQSSSRH